MVKVIDEKKLARQWQGLNLVIDNFKIGLGATLEWCTAMGKTFASILLIKRMLEKDKTRSTIVIVPTVQLKEQWEREFKEHKIPNCKVYVVNTAITLDLSCHLLILDELHLYGSEENSKVFDIRRTWTLGLTATLFRLDGKHKWIAEKVPVVDTIPLEVARENGWVAEYLEYNWGIYMTPSEAEEYRKINKEFHKYFAFFGHDFNLANKCKNRQQAEEFAQKMGWDTQTTQFRAVRFNHFMRKRKEFLHSAESKVLASYQALLRFPYKTITFSESTKFADELTSRLGPIAVCYHTKLPTQVREIVTIKKYKKKPEKRIVKYVKFGKTKLKREALDKISDNRYKVRIINTARALDQGFNVEDIEFVLTASGTSNPTQDTQRKGRGGRKFTFKNGKDKIALFINIYFIGTQDEKWLKKRQTDPKTGKPKNPFVKHINSLDEITYGNQFGLPEGSTLSATGT
jgi:superfamily II DNA or RNA helicase